jgi:hypothetical protein
VYSLARCLWLADCSCVVSDSSPSLSIESAAVYGYAVLLRVGARRGTGTHGAIWVWFHLPAYRKTERYVFNAGRFTVGTLKVVALMLTILESVLCDTAATADGFRQSDVVFLGPAPSRSQLENVTCVFAIGYRAAHVSKRSSCRVSHCFLRSWLQFGREREYPAWKSRLRYRRNQSTERLGTSGLRTHHANLLGAFQGERCKVDLAPFPWCRLAALVRPCSYLPRLVSNSWQLCVC